MARSYAAIFAAFFLFFGTSQLFAQDITLTSQDGAVEITGTLLGYDGEFYRVETPFGELTVDGSGVSCDGPGCPNLSAYVAQVGFSGSADIANTLLPPLFETYALRNGLTIKRENRDPTHLTYVFQDGKLGTKLARFLVRANTTDEGFADLLANEADIVLAQREIRDEERRRARAAGMGDLTKANRSRVLALDALVPVVAAANPVRAVSLPELVDVLSGEIDNWAEFGGPDAPITVYLPVLGSGLMQATEDRLLLPAKAEATPTAKRHAQNSDLTSVVSKDPFGIGIARFSDPGLTRILTLTGVCDHALAVDRRSIKTEDYPLTSPMFIYTPARRLPAIARDFLTFVQSPAAQIVIRRSGLVDQLPEQISINMQGNRLANAILAAGEEVTLEDLQRMLTLMQPMNRLTTSFRFEAGSSTPDAQSQSNVLQLARALESGPYEAKRLTFVGFSDGDGPPATNQKISESREKSVRDAVLAAAETLDPKQVQLDVAGFGETLPMACDDSTWGRKVNRRVEVWVR